MKCGTFLKGMNSDKARSNKDIDERRTYQKL